MVDDECTMFSVSPLNSHQKKILSSLKLLGRYGHSGEEWVKGSLQ